MTDEPKPKTIDAAGTVTVGTLRKRMWRSLTPRLAHEIGITWEEQRDFLALRSIPPPEKLHLLCKRLGLL